MKGSLSSATVDRNEPTTQRRLLNMAADSYSTNQPVVVPWFAGREVTPCVWLGEAYNQFTKPAPTERPGKK